MALDWYFDFVSPFAYLQLEVLRRDHPQIELRPVPVVLGALFAHWGTIGPAELPAKRRFTYRHVLWQARERGIPMRFPPAHPFNPLAALRLFIAAGGGVEVAERIFRRIWCDGEQLDTPASLVRLAAELGFSEAEVGAALADAQVKAALRTHTEQAVARGVFGVPTLRIGDDLFWGLDATGMALAALAEPGLFGPDALGSADELPVAIERTRPA